MNSTLYSWMMPFWCSVGGGSQEMLIDVLFSLPTISTVTCCGGALGAAQYNTYHWSLSSLQHTHTHTHPTPPHPTHTHKSLQESKWIFNGFLKWPRHLSKLLPFDYNKHCWRKQLLCRIETFWLTLSYKYTWSMHGAFKCHTIPT